MNQPAATNITGEVSLGNFTEEPLGIGETWEGQFEDVKDVAFMSITVSSDKASAQTVRSVLAGRKDNGIYINLKCTDDGQLIIKAILHGVTDNGDIVPVKVTSDGKLVIGGGQ